MFCFYFAMFANLTPPVALASFAAAGLSGGSPMKTGWQSVKLALAGFIVPFMFVYNPQLLLENVTILSGIQVVLTSCVGVVLIAAAVEGYLFGRMNWVLRIISMAGALLGGCPNTTYGESVACVAITRNASVVTILMTALCAIVVSFFSPFVAFVNSIPGCVMGGTCIALYGFIAVSGLKMIQKVDLGKNSNLFVVSTILIAGIGGLSLTFGKITITPVAVALILGILANLMLKKEK